MKSIDIPNGVLSIQQQSFDGCSGLTSIVIPHSVTSIEELAFGNCANLSSITISNNVTSIGNGAFYGCTKINSIHCKCINPPFLGSIVFYKLNYNNVTLYVPEGALQAYRTAYGWNSFLNIVEE